MIFPRSVWLEISNKEVEASLNNEWVDTKHMSNEKIVKCLIARIEYAERYANRKAALWLLEIEGIDLR